MVEHVLERVDEVEPDETFSKVRAFSRQFEKESCGLIMTGLGGSVLCTGTPIPDSKALLTIQPKLQNEIPLCGLLGLFIFNY